MASQDPPGTAVSTGTLGRFGSQAVWHLRAGFDNSPHPMLMADDQRRWICGNAAASELLRTSQGEIPWRTMDDFTTPTGIARLDRHWNAFLATGAAEGWYELQVPSADSITVEFSAIANVQPGRHLSVFIQSEGRGIADARDPSAPHASWAPVASAGSSPTRLTTREREMITLIAGGGQSVGMADDLFLSPETVKTHVQNAMTKLGAHTRAHAVAIALVTGQITWSLGEAPRSGSGIPPEDPLSG
jgi:DNA-binding CsgD family transcriptional regulator